MTHHEHVEAALRAIKAVSEAFEARHITDQICVLKTAANILENKMNAAIMDQAVENVFKK